MKKYNLILTALIMFASTAAYAVDIDIPDGINIHSGEIIGSSQLAEVTVYVNRLDGTTLAIEAFTANINLNGSVVVYPVDKKKFGQQLTLPTISIKAIVYGNHTFREW